MHGWMDGWIDNRLSYIDIVITRKLFVYDLNIYLNEWSLFLPCHSKSVPPRKFLSRSWLRNKALSNNNNIHSFMFWKLILVREREGDKNMA